MLAGDLIIALAGNRMESFELEFKVTSGNKQSGMKSSVSGRFYFKQTSNGNLLGEWSNNHETRVFTESADLISDYDEKAGKFVGSYNATWQEGGQAHFATLKISRSGSQFKLEWRGQAKFDGDGMLCDDILIGDYRSVK